MGKTKIVAGALFIAGLVLAPISATAATSWQGSDRSDDYTQSIRIYDGEDDYHPVRVEYKMETNSSSRHLYNYNGPSTSKSESTAYRPARHRAIEILNNRPDAYGAWVNAR